jgi:rRNA processing protein Krr1/Pno1
MASETAVIARQSSTLSIIGTVKDALVFCDEQDRRSDPGDEMRAATQMIRAMARTFQPNDLLRL